MQVIPFENVREKDIYSPADVVSPSRASGKRGSEEEDDEEAPKKWRNSSRESACSDGVSVVVIEQRRRVPQTSSSQCSDCSENLVHWDQCRLSPSAEVQIGIVADLVQFPPLNACSEDIKQQTHLVERAVHETCGSMDFFEEEEDFDKLDSVSDSFRSEMSDWRFLVSRVLPASKMRLFESMTLKQCKHLPNIEFISNTLTGLQEWQREKLVDWMLDVVFDYRYHPRTAYLSVNYLDRFFCLCTTPVAINSIQLFGATCILVAAKYEEVHPPLINDLVSFCANLYTFEQFLKCEQLVLNILGFDLSLCTPCDFLSMYRENCRSVLDALSNDTHHFQNSSPGLSQCSEFSSRGSSGNQSFSSSSTPSLSEVKNKYENRRGSEVILSPLDFHRLSLTPTRSSTLVGLADLSLSSTPSSPMLDYGSPFSSERCVGTSSSIVSSCESVFCDSSVILTSFLGNGMQQSNSNSLHSTSPAVQFCCRSGFSHPSFNEVEKVADSVEEDLDTAVSFSFGDVNSECDRLYAFAHYLIMASLTNSKLASCRPSELCVSAVVLSRASFGLESPWCPLLRVLFGDSVRSDESLIAVMHDMREYVCEAAKSSCNAIHRHFSRSRCLSSGSHALVEVPDLPESGFYLDKRCLHL